MPASILIVEDEPAIRSLLEISLRKFGYAATCVEDASTAMAQINNELPDLILLDWMLPGISGVHFARQLRANQRTQDVPIIMLTARDAESDKVDGLGSGADDYVTKPFSPRELNARIEAVLRRRKPQAGSEDISLAGLLLKPALRQVELEGKESDDKSEHKVNLGNSEFRLLHFFMTHPNRIHSRFTLLDKVWGDHVFIEERTVDVHIKRLRQALKAVGKDYLIRTVRGSGYCFSPNNEL